MTTSPVSNTDTHELPGKSPNSLVRRAWISVAFIPVAFALVLVLGEGLMSELGYPGGEPDALPPIGIGVLVGIPLMVLAMLPGGLAAYFGLRARRTGDIRGTVPAAIGVSFALYMLFTNMAGIVQRLLD